MTVEVTPGTPDEFWADYEAHTGLSPAANRVQWRDRGARIAQLETELDHARAEAARLTDRLTRMVQIARDRDADLRAAEIGLAAIARVKALSDGVAHLKSSVRWVHASTIAEALAAEPTPAAEPHAQDVLCPTCRIPRGDYWGACPDRWHWAVEAWKRPAPVADPSGNEGGAK